MVRVCGFEFSAEGLGLKIYRASGTRKVQGLGLGFKVQASDLCMFPRGVKISHATSQLERN